MCYQVVGVPGDLPSDLCDCRTLRMLDARAEERTVQVRADLPPIHPLHPEIITILQDNTLRVLHQEISPGESLELSAHEARSRLNEWAK